MSKGNVVLGYGRGAIGDLVLTRLKGQQVAKARNRHPANPRTSLQMRQRAGFVAPLKFYTRGIQNLFQFAFTDKRLKESDYNAFMRVNVGAGFPLTPDEFRNPGFPALGSWVMSRGSLSAPLVENPGPASNRLGYEVSGVTANSTIAELSNMFIGGGNAEEGDIITLVYIIAYGAVVSPTSISVDEGAEVVWHIDQFKIDSNSTRECSDVLPFSNFYEYEGETYLGIAGSSVPVNEATAGMAIIRSRITSKGLLVSNSRLVCGSHVNEFVEFRNTPAEIARVLAEWGASSAAILKGGLLS